MEPGAAVDAARGVRGVAGQRGRRLARGLRARTPRLAAHRTRLLRRQVLPQQAVVDAPPASARHSPPPCPRLSTRMRPQHYHGFISTYYNRIGFPAKNY